MTIPGLFVFNVIYLVSAYAVLALQGLFVAGVTVGIVADLRNFERMVARDVAQPRCRPGRLRQSLRSVFGGWQKCPLWCLPVGTFHGVDEYLLMHELDGLLE
jgi:hypothetical protein